MNVYIDGIGNSEEMNTKIAMRVIKCAALMLAKWPEDLNTNPVEAATFITRYFGAVVEQHGSESLEDIYRVVDGLKEYEEKFMPHKVGNWPSRVQIKTQFEAFQQSGNEGLLAAIVENQKRMG